MPGQGPQNETQLVKRMTKAITARTNVWMMKTHGDGYQRVGIPDLLICYRGRFVAIEVKHQKPGETVDHLLGRVTKRQQIELDDLSAAGAFTAVAWTVEQVEEILDAVDDVIDNT